MAGFGRVNCFACRSRGPQWCDLDREGLSLLDKIKTRSTYRRGQTIFSQGNPCLGIHCIEHGVVALRKTGTTGDAILMAIAHPGEALGYGDYFARAPYSVAAEALQAAEVCFIERSGLTQLLERNPMLGQTFLQRLATDLEHSEALRLQAAMLPVRTRLVHLLLALKEHFGTADEQGCLTIDLPLSRQDLASIVGTRPETIARTIRTLESEGLAFFDRRRVLIDDIDPLLDEINAP